MSEPFLGSLMLTAFNFAPKGWALCAGQLMPINQNQALFSLLGTTYGGDGRVTFGLPDLRGRTVVMNGPGFALGQQGGEESHTLNAGEVPIHTHSLQATTDPANSGAAAGNLLATTSGSLTIYKQNPQNVNQFLSGPTVTPVGSSLPHENRQPFLTMTWIIALQGIFPSRN